MRKVELKERKGITLVALVITIIVLLILAGVTISLVIGENGLINKSKETEKITFETEVSEAIELKLAELEIEKTEKGGKVKITDLLEEGYVNEEGVVNIRKLLGKTGKYGNGTDKKDVYAIENNELWYYDKNGEGKKLSKLSNLVYIATPAEYFEVTERDGKKIINLKGYDEYYVVDAQLEAYVIPNILNDEVIEEVGMFKARNIKSIIIQDGIKTIGDYAFGGCSSLTNVIIPDSVMNIGNYAFEECSSLTNIAIPSSVTNIGEGAFSGCSSLTNIDVDSNNKVYSSIDGVLFNKEKTELIYYPGNKQNYEYKIPDSVTNIGNYAFSGCSSLTTVNYTGTKEQWNNINIDSQASLDNATINYNYKE